jgi:hypothetical protein
MADLEFSLDDVTSLIEKISTLRPDLSDQELVLLMSIFALAAEHTVPTEALREPPGLIPPPTVEDLKQQLLHAFSPDGSLHSATGTVAEAATTTTYSIHRHPGSIHR